MMWESNLFELIYPSDEESSVSSSILESFVAPFGKVDNDTTEPNCQTSEADSDAIIMDPSRSVSWSSLPSLMTGIPACDKLIQGTIEINSITPGNGTSCSEFSSEVIFLDQNAADTFDSSDSSPLDRESSTEVGVTNAIDFVAVDFVAVDSDAVDSDAIRTSTGLKGNYLGAQSTVSEKCSGALGNEAVYKKPSRAKRARRIRKLRQAKLARMPVGFVQGFIAITGDLNPSEALTANTSDVAASESVDLPILSENSCEFIEPEATKDLVLSKKFDTENALTTENTDEFESKFQESSGGLTLVGSVIADSVCKPESISGFVDPISYSEFEMQIDTTGQCIGNIPETLSNDTHLCDTVYNGVEGVANSPKDSNYELQLALGFEILSPEIMNLDFENCLGTITELNFRAEDLNSPASTEFEVTVPKFQPESYFAEPDINALSALQDVENESSSLMLDSMSPISLDFGTSDLIKALPAENYDYERAWDDFETEYNSGLDWAETFPEPEYFAAYPEAGSAFEHGMNSIPETKISSSSTGSELATAEFDLPSGEDLISVLVVNAGVFVEEAELASIFGRPLSTIPEEDETEEEMPSRVAECTHYTPILNLFIKKDNQAETMTVSNLAGSEPETKTDTVSHQLETAIEKESEPFWTLIETDIQSESFEEWVEANLSLDFANLITISTNDTTALSTITCVPSTCQFLPKLMSSFDSLVSSQDYNNYSADIKEELDLSYLTSMESSTTLTKLLGEFESAETNSDNQSTTTSIFNNLYDTTVRVLGLTNTRSIAKYHYIGTQQAPNLSSITKKYFSPLFNVKSKVKQKLSRFRHDIIHVSI